MLTGRYLMPAPISVVAIIFRGAVMLRSLFVLATLALLFTACGPPSEPSQAAIDAARATMSAEVAIIPTIPSPTAVSLADVDLESLVLQSGDLPSGIQRGQVRAAVPNAFKGVPAAEQTFNQILERTGSSTGNVTILLYRETNKRDTAYGVMVKGAGSRAQPSNGVGEQAIIFPGTRDLPVSSVSFVRCHAAVDITLGDVSAETLMNYAKWLDSRLQEVVCS
jgi:hypothetical protein